MEQNISNIHKNLLSSHSKEALWSNCTFVCLSYDRSCTFTQEFMFNDVDINNNNNNKVLLIKMANERQLVYQEEDD